MYNEGRRMSDKVDEIISEVAVQNITNDLENTLKKIRLSPEIIAFRKTLMIWQSNFKKVFQAIQEILEPYRDAISQISKAVLVPNPSLIYRLQLAQKGWLLPLDFLEFDILSNSATVEDGIEKVMIEDNLLMKIQQKTEKRLIYPSFKQQFKDAIECFNIGYYAACVYSLSPIIEGLVENTTNPNSVKLIKSFECQAKKLGQQAIDDKRTHMFILMLTYLQDVYAKDIKFENNEPTIINRNWLAHGKYKNKLITKKDCLQLFCALAAMTDVVEDINSLEFDSAV